MEGETSETEVGLDGWCEGGLGQQRNDGGGCAECEKDRIEWRALVHMKLNEFHAAIFARPSVHSDRPPVLWWLSPERGGMPLNVAVGINCQKGATTENQGSNVRYMG